MKSGCESYTRRFLVKAIMGENWQLFRRDVDLILSIPDLLPFICSGITFAPFVRMQPVSETKSTISQLLCQMS